MAQNSPGILIEASWEVVNKVGGINTVVRTKAKLLNEHYDDYILVGPLFPERRDVEFSEAPPPERLLHIFEQLRNEGIHCVYGAWNIPGNPATVLINARESHIDLNHVKGLLWEKYKIDSLHASWGFTEPLQWAWAVGKFIEKYQQAAESEVVAHLHEWLAGFAILYLKLHGVKCGTVFTTHATMLGRTLTGVSSQFVSDVLEIIDPVARAKQLKVQDKHTTEVACAHAADIFTTVSDITALEAEHLLGRKPDLILYNGIARDSYPQEDDMMKMHVHSRERLREFIDYYFFSHYDFKLEESLIFFTSGRYEFRNKGYDVFIESLERLNNYLQSQNSPKTIVALFLVPGETHGVKTEVLEERATYAKLRATVHGYSDRIQRRIIRKAANLDNLSAADLVDEEMRTEIARVSQSLKHAGNPPLCTHNIPWEGQDPIVSSLRANGLENSEDDKVKVVRIPVYLDGRDGIIDLPYEEVVAGTNLGVFPSAYEPWGYTPVETVAMGVPAVTTDLAGFGRFIAERQEPEGGAWVLSRDGKSRSETVEELFQVMKTYCELDEEARHKEKRSAKEISALATWETFIKRYYQAHQAAYEKNL